MFNLLARKRWTRQEGKITYALDRPKKNQQQHEHKPIDKRLKYGLFFFERKKKGIDKRREDNIWSAHKEQRKKREGHSKSVLHFSVFFYWLYGQRNIL